MKFNLSKVTTAVEKAQFTVKKNSPLIMTTVGVAGLVGTAVLAYRARTRVKEIVEGVEEAREYGEEVNTVQVVTQVGVALAPTVILGSLSIMSIVGSYHVLTNRNSLLATALSTAISENRAIKARIREQYPNAIIAPIESQEEVTTKGDDGKKKKVTVVDPKDIPSLEGAWYHTSEEYVKDDHHYNQTNIATRQRLLDNKLQERGFLCLNDVLSALSMPTMRMGSILGWTSAQYFDLTQTVVQCKDTDGNLYPDIWIEWPETIAIYDKANYASDLKSYNY